MTTLQAILFDNNIWTCDNARKWLKTHNFKPIKTVHKTEKFLRYRIHEPNFKNYSTKILNNGIRMIYGLD